jgi:hypothetical protein
VQAAFLKQWQCAESASSIPHLPSPISHRRAELEHGSFYVNDSIQAKFKCGSITIRYVPDIKTYNEST